MRCCMVPDCKINYKNHEGESVSRFPRCPEIRNAWLSEIPRENYIITKYEYNHQG